MTWWKKTFEILLWKSRLIVVLAVVPSIVGGVVLFGLIAVESFRVLVDLLHYLDPALPLGQRETLLKQSILRMISAAESEKNSEEALPGRSQNPP
jgi:uncharacterized membrane protein YqhA